MTELDSMPELKSRKTRDEVYMDMALAIAQRSTCTRAFVGAVLVSGDLISHGYNGAPPGVPHCIDVGCNILMEELPHGTQEKCFRTIHAEVNAILRMPQVDLSNATLYTTHRPCFACSQIIISRKIGRVLFLVPYEDDKFKTNMMMKRIMAAITQQMRLE